MSGVKEKRGAEEQFKQINWGYHVIEGSKLPEGRSPSGWRGYRPNLWRDLYESCSGDAMSIQNCQIQVRTNYRNWENGRLHEVLDKLHNALIRFDPDELKDFHKKYSGVLQLVNEFAVIEELWRLKVDEKEIR